ncbi:MAG TPA: tyrosinase family protein [Candidatus Cybelea sp.]|nr:tyrosinase family protein [Candidatus Cybelea sp.]
MNRGRFLLSSTSVAALAACSSSSPMLTTAPQARRLGAGSPFTATTYTRVELTEFSKNAKLVAAFRAGIKAMRELTDERNTNAYKYWHYSHWMPSGKPPEDMQAVFNQCKHKQSYFLPWHRGFLYFFEKTLREASGDIDFALPYWDYYKNPELPPIFTQETLKGGEPNPLYWPGRTGTTVTGLTFKAFADTVTVFPWGPGETFEDLTERNPHDRVHGQVGGSMGRVPTAVADPIFWVHHCNIDRYWSAWLAAGGERHMPAKKELWWDTVFAYNLDRSWNVGVKDMNDSENLGYTYSDLSLPAPPRGASLPLRPGVVATGFANAAGPIALDLRPVTIEIPLDERTARASFVDVVLEGVEMTALGERGGYDYTVYANLPASPAPLSEGSRFEIGEFGSFTLSTPPMTGMAMPANGSTLRLRAQRPGSTLALSFVAFAAGSRVPASSALVRIGRITVVAR